MAAQHMSLRSGHGSGSGCRAARVRHGHTQSVAPLAASWTSGAAAVTRLAPGCGAPPLAPARCPAPFSQQPSRASRAASVLARASDAAADAAPPQPPQPPAGAPYWRTHISRKPVLLQALYECLAGIKAGGPLPEQVDLAMVYVSSAYEQDFPLLVEALKQQVPGLRNVFGCTGFGIIGVDGEGAHEVEAASALSLTLARIPQAEVVVRHVDTADLPDGDAPPQCWSTLLGVPAFPECPLSFVVLADPTFGEVQDLLAGLDFAFPIATKIGGLSSSTPSFTGSTTATFAWSAATASPAAAAAAAAASPASSTSSTTGTSSAAGSSSASPSASASSPSPSPSSSASPSSPGSSTTSGGGMFTRGAAVLSLHGEVHMDLLIAQGCRPLTTTTWTVDKVAPGDPTRILALSAEGVARGRPLPALEAFQVELQSVLGGMTETQLRRTVSNLTVGVAPEGLKPAAELEPQDFLIRALRGFDAEQALVVGDYMRAGQRLRFMVRDKQGAQEDLTSHGLAFKRKQLQAMLMGGTGGGEGAAPPSQPFGMLVFTCNGRGSGLYGEDSYDARTLSTYVPVPVAGFQCNGEIGRVGNTTHLHGFTCAAGVLRLTNEVGAVPPPPGSAAGAAPSSTSSASSGPPAAAPAPPPQQPQPPSAPQQE
ncbi:hypothetical protein HYH02_004920 [Chlamydomonas schloesseri]|uniref:FIST C-domain domain-containing protein n=1 Tax=Chlamydomonas schloesseri TaxID=2026947 RepID=A0A835WMB2_9CHLO|nr:hypothetical protein HYH02_004920 [Chlamydomonas schloesseri]|eukprot:KAG2450418.1 hypothetical protein HYH02_004920 [Chlamydomonas schloesseri]